MTTSTHDRRDENAPGNLGKALALLIAWGREQDQPADDPCGDDAPQLETAESAQ
jgi:hypothetical protein